MPSDATERWLALSAQFPIGPKRTPGLRSSTPPQGVDPGQIRHASWKDTAALVLVDEVNETAALARVIPVSLEAGVESADSLTIDAEASPLHGPLTVWPNTSSWVPYSTLDDTIATLPTSLLRALRSSDLPGGVHRGRPDPIQGSGAAMAIDELFDALDALSVAPRFKSTVVAGARERLNIPLPTVMTALHATQPRAMAILLGKEFIEPDEAEALAAAANIPVSEIWAGMSPLPPDLERELQEPRWRRTIARRAHDGDEVLARRKLGYEIYQLAARERGDGRDRWRQRLEAFLSTESD